MLFYGKAQKYEQLRAKVKRALFHGDIESFEDRLVISKDRGGGSKLLLCAHEQGFCQFLTIW